MRFLGVDPGFGICGFAFLEKVDDEILLRNFGVIRTTAQKIFRSRLAEIAADFQKILEKFRPQIVSIENLFFAQNISTAVRVAEIRGVLVFLAQKFGAQICEPRPTEIKKIFTGNGRAGKAEIKKMARIIFSLEKNPALDDAADAIAAGFFAAQNFKIFTEK